MASGRSEIKVESFPKYDKWKNFPQPTLAWLDSVTANGESFPRTTRVIFIVLQISLCSVVLCLCLSNFHLAKQKERLGLPARTARVDLLMHYLWFIFVCTDKFHLSEPFLPAPLVYNDSCFKGARIRKGILHRVQCCHIHILCFFLSILTVILRKEEKILAVLPFCSGFPFFCYSMPVSVLWQHWESVASQHDA